MWYGFAMKNEFVQNGNETAPLPMSRREMKARGIWESRQAPFKRALQRHPSSQRWERFVAEAGLVDRMAKGRAEGDPWLALERLLLAVAEAQAVRLLARGAR